MKAHSPVLTAELVPLEVVYAKNQPPYAPLSVLRSKRGIVMSRWRLTEKERAEIAAGSDILLSVWTSGDPLQPLYMEVAECDRGLSETAAWIGAI